MKRRRQCMKKRITNSLLSFVMAVCVLNSSIAPFAVHAAKTYSDEKPAYFLENGQITKSGYSFGGWYTNAKFTGEQVVYGQFMANPGKYKTLYAKWVK